MNKICTTIEQSKKLIEIGIDITTADMSYSSIHNVGQEISYCNVPLAVYPIGDAIPAWSLSTLIDLISFPNLFYNKGDGWNLSVEINDKIVNISNAATPLDAAFEMVCWLKENKKI